jgi:hypothetical protein
MMNDEDNVRATERKGSSVKKGPNPQCWWPNGFRELCGRHSGIRAFSPPRSFLGTHTDHG